MGDDPNMRGNSRRWLTDERSAGAAFAPPEAAYTH